MSHIPKNPATLDDLDIHELLVVAYPEKFSAYKPDSDEQWEATQAFWQELAHGGDDGDCCALNDFVVRLLHCTTPQAGLRADKAMHGFGVPEFQRQDGKLCVLMTAAVTRECILEVPQ